MTSPILLQSPETRCQEPSNDPCIESFETPFFEKENGTLPLKKLLNLCQENILKKIVEKKQKEDPSCFFTDLDFFLEETEFDADSLDQPIVKKKKPEDSQVTLLHIPLPLIRPLLDSELSLSSVYSISSESLLLFDKMCSEMLVMNSESSSKTSIILESAEFIHSPFYGSEITIEEFSTAPKIFNVSIRTNESAVILIQSHMAGFMQLLEDRNFSFGINRIDTSINSESSLSKEVKKMKKKQDKFSPLGEDPKDERTL